MSRGMSLMFATITCDRCGGVRLMSQPCAECGLRPRPHETQPDLERRRKLLRELKGAAPMGLDDVSTNVDDALDEIPTLIRNVTSALARASKTTSRSARGLIEAFAALDARVTFWSQRQPRPATNRGRSLGRSLQLLRRGLGVFADALGEPTMLAAQAKESEGQRLIDAAVEELKSLREIGESEQLLSADGLGPIGASARALAGGDEALELLDQKLQRIAGREESDRPLGLGLNLHLFRQLMLALLDIEECLEVARAAEEELGDLSSICLDPGWQARHGVVTAQFSSAAFNLSRIDEENDLEAAGAALQLVMQCRDGVIRHCLATLLATDATAYHALTRRGTGYVIKNSSSRFPQLRLEENLPQGLRHAAAHADYDVVDDMFVTNFGGTEVRLTLDEFLDQVLGYLQTSVSLLVALLSATSVQGIELEISRHTPERDLLAAMAMLVGFVGFADASVVREQSMLRVAGAGDVERFSTAAAGLAAIAPETVERICAWITDDQGETRVWEAPVAPYREYAMRDPVLSEPDSLIAMAQLMSAVRIDSQSAWNTDVWAGIAMLIFNQTDAWPLRERVRRLREVRDLARANEQPVVGDTITTILRALRQANPSAAVPSSTAFIRETR
jgi:hypothetical protein